jgi:hypothetical protein
MKNFKEIKNLALDKIVLLCFLVVSLFAAKWVVDTRSGVHLSEAKILNPMGLAVKMPQGNGWQSAERWHYEPSQYWLEGIYTHPAIGQRTAALKCQYLLFAQGLTNQQIIAQKAERLGAKIVESKKLTTATLSFEWSLMQDNQGQNHFMAVTKLPDGRQLNIELSEWANDEDYAQRTFRTVLKNVTFEDNKLLNYGTLLVAKIKNQGLASFLPKPQKDFFLITDNKKNNLGFQMDFLTVAGPYNKLAVKGVDFFYFNKTTPFEIYSTYQGDNFIDKFSWKQQTSTSEDNAEISLEKGSLNVRRFVPQPQQIIFDLNSAAIPDVFLKQLFVELFKSSYERIVVDDIEPGGSVIPMVVRKIQVPKDYSFAVRIQLLDDERLFQDIFFDKKMEYVKIQQPERNIILEKTSMENIIKQFPENAEHIQNINNEFEILKLK